MGSGAIIVTGVRQIDRRLKTLETRVQRKILRQSMRKGLKGVQAAAKALVPVDSGLTRDNIKVRAMKRKRGRTGLAVVIANSDEFRSHGSPLKRYFYPTAVELGHRPGVPPHRFMRPAYQSAGPAARDTTMAELLRGTLAEASK